jgi:asparagine N-glycosylation enzyme membrane subunit Stt3
MDFLMTAWQSYPVLIDFVLFAFVFAAVARVSSAKAFPEHAGKALSIAVAVFLAAGLAMAQRKLGFSVESMGPVAILILAVVIFITSYKFLRHSDMPRPMPVVVDPSVQVIQVISCGTAYSNVRRGRRPFADSSFYTRSSKVGPTHADVFRSIPFGEQARCLRMMFSLGGGFRNAGNAGQRVPISRRELSAPVLWPYDCS